MSKSSTDGNPSASVCLFCCSPISRPTTVSNCEGNLLSASLNNYFILRHVLDLPEDLMTYYLAYCETPEAWISVCQLCNKKYVQPCSKLFHQLNEIQKQIQELKVRVDEVIKVSSKQFHQAKVPFVRNITLEAREFVVNRPIQSNAVHRPPQPTSTPLPSLVSTTITILPKEEPVNPDSSSDYAPENDDNHHSDASSGDYESRPKRFSARALSYRNPRYNINRKPNYSHKPGSPEPYQCKLCSYKCKTSKGVRVHIINIHFKNRPIRKKGPCERCGKVFFALKPRQNHLCHRCIPAKKPETRAPRPVYVCSECDFKTEGIENYNRHRARLGHLSEITDLTCPTCRKLYSCKAELDKHLKLKSCSILKCDECERTFDRPSKFKEHLQLFHSNTMFNCDHADCDFSTNTEYKLRIHKRCTHGNHKERTKHTCPICQKVYNRPFQVRDHIAKKHPDKVDEINEQILENKIMSKAETNSNQEQSISLVQD